MTTSALSTPFKQQYDYNDRLAESNRVLNKYPGKIPAIIERALNSDAPNIEKNKYIFPADLSVNQVAYVIRKRANLDSSVALNVHVGGNTVNGAAVVSALYERHKDEDGFLYITYSASGLNGNLVVQQ